MEAERAQRPLGRVLLTGATGMVGSSVLSALIEDASTTGIVSLGRRLSGRQHAKLTEVDFTAFGDADAIAPHVAGINMVFHCLATYSARVSQEDYQMITLDWLHALVRACESVQPDMTFCLFSAQGARPDGGGMSFALKIKGEAENALFASGISRKFAFRPGYIAPSGKRKWKPADYLFTPLQRLLPSIGVTADKLAQAMLRSASGDHRTSAFIENGEMRALIA